MTLYPLMAIKLFFVKCVSEISRISIFLVLINKLFYFDGWKAVSIPYGYTMDTKIYLHSLFTNIIIMFSKFDVSSDCFINSFSILSNVDFSCSVSSRTTCA